MTKTLLINGKPVEFDDDDDESPETDTKKKPAVPIDTLFYYWFMDYGQWSKR